MNIAVASDRPDLNGRVPELFSHAPWVLIVDFEEQLSPAGPEGAGQSPPPSARLLEALDGAGRSDEETARLIVERDCEGLLCGPIEREPFLIIADEGGVTRFLAAGLTVEESLRRLAARDLELIRDHIGGQGPHRHGPRGCEESGRHH